VTLQGVAVMAAVVVVAITVLAVAGWWLLSRACASLAYHQLFRAVDWHDAGAAASRALATTAAPPAIDEESRGLAIVASNTDSRKPPRLNSERRWPSTPMTSWRTTS
jgi:hypothetical protein